MKIFVVTEIGYEYDDCHFQRGEGEGSPVKSYRLKENAEKERDRLNKERLDKGGYYADPDTDDDEVVEKDGSLVFKDYYKVVELEVVDDEVVSYKDAREAVDQASARSREAAKVHLYESSKKLFEDHPLLESFGWTQYSMYFNDGDECPFRAHTDDFKINGEDLCELDYHDGMTYDRSLKKYVLTGQPDAMGFVVNTVSDFLSLFSEDDLEQLFGNHKEITVYRDKGVVISNYTDHD